MADIATLGFQVDSRPIQTASKALQDLGASSQKSSTQLGAIEAMAKRAGVSVEEMTRRVDAATGSTQNFQRQVTTLVAANDNFGASLGRVHAGAEGLVGSFQGMAVAAAGAVLGITGLASVFTKFIEETSEAQKVQALLQATLNATGGSAGQTIDSLNDMAKALQGVSTFSDEAVGSAQNVLLRFTMVREVFEQATKAAVDLAAGTGKDLTAAANLVGKALDDPVRALRFLRSAQVDVHGANEELIKSLVESGDVLKAQGIILKELEGRYGGAAEALRNTLGGALSGLKNAFGDLFEQTGPQADKLVEAINNLTKALSDPSVVGAVQAFGAAFFNELTKIISFFTQLNVEINRVKLTLSQVTSGNFAGALNLAGPSAKGLDELRVGAGSKFSTSDATSFYDTVIGKTKEAAAETKKFVGVNEAWAASAKSAGDAQGKAALDALEIMRNNVTALGGAATAAEKYQLQVAELAKKLQEGTISQDTFNRAVAFLNPTVSTLRESITSLGDGLAQAFIKGQKAGEALNNTLQSLAAKAASKAITSLLTGDFASAALNAGVAAVTWIGSKLFGGGDKEEQAAAQKAAAEAERQRQEREKVIAEAQIRAADFSLRAANAMEKSGFIVQIRQFDAESQKAFDEESKRAGDIAIWQLVAARAAERTKLIADTIDEATNTLAGNELSEVQTRLKAIAEASDTLGKALQETGLSAEAAASAVADKLNPALDKLRSQFVDDITRKINELAGGSWINDLSDLLKQVASLKADASSLGGVDSGLIDTFTVLAAQKIVNSAQLTGDAFAAVQRSIGGLGSQLHAFGTAIEETAAAVKRSLAEIASAIQSNEDALFNLVHSGDSLADQLARFDLDAQRRREAEAAAGGEAMVSLEALIAAQRLDIINRFNLAAADAAAKAAADAADAKARADADALRAEQQAAAERQRAIDEATKFLTNALQNIANFISHFLAGSGSNLSPAARLASAQGTFSSQYSSALGGNRDALSGITGNAQDVIDAATAYYGSSAAGQSIISGIIAQLQSLPAQVSAEQFIVDGLTTPIVAVGTSVSTQTTTLNNSLDTMRLTLQTAMLSGNPAAVAAALSPFFDSLDTNTDGLLDFNEFQTGLAGMASNFALRDMFTRLDTDNSGNLTRLELIKAATQGTQTSVGSIDSSNASINTKSDRLGFIDNSTAQAAVSLLALAQISNNTGTTATQTQSTATNTGNTVNALGAGNLTAIISAMANNIGTIASWAPNTNHATGGYITGPGTGTSDSIHANLSTGEYVINARDTVWSRPILDAINYGHRMPGISAQAGNDNSPVVTAINNQTRVFVGALRELISVEMRSAGLIAGQIEEGNKVSRRRRGQKRAA